MTAATLHAPKTAACANLIDFLWPF
jgi:hypothetical protein